MHQDRVGRRVVLRVRVERQDVVLRCPAQRGRLRKRRRKKRGTERQRGDQGFWSHGISLLRIEADMLGAARAAANGESPHAGWNGDAPVSGSLPAATIGGITNDADMELTAVGRCATANSCC